MKKNGFTLVELLATLIILGLLIVLTIPAYTTVYSGIRRENYNGKVSEITAAALKYGSSIKDEIKNANERCVTTTVDFLITKGLLVSESDSSNVIYNPTNEKPLDANIKICYSIPKFDLVAYYIQDFSEEKYYYKGEVVSYNNKMYSCVIDYPGKGGIYATNNKSKKYFEELTY